jgi:subtilisin family serine protease
MSIPPMPEERGDAKFLSQLRALRAAFGDVEPAVGYSEEGAPNSVYAALTTGHYTYRDPASDHCRYCPPPPFEPGCTCLTAPAEGSPAEFTGLASRSGTSFATLIVVGMIAARMSRTDERSRDAAAALIASAPVLPCVGPVLVPPTWTLRG